MATRGVSSGGGGGSSPSVVILGANGAKLTMTYISELITIGGGATTNSIANLLPANAWIMGIVMRVVTLVPAPVSTLAISATTDGTIFMSAVSPTAGTTDSMFSNQQISPFFNSTAQKLTITKNPPSGTGGQVRLTTFYYTLTPPTS